MPGSEDRLREELRLAAEPGDPSGAFDRVLERKIRRRIHQKIELVSLAGVVLIGSLTGALLLARAVRPGVPRIVAGGGRTGAPPLQGGICETRGVLQGDFDGDGRIDTAEVTSHGQVEGCSAGSPRTWVLAAVFADGGTSTVVLDCPSACAAVAAPDLNHDGPSELLIDVRHGASTIFLRVFQGRSLAPVTVARGNDQYPGGRPLTLQWAGGITHPDAIACSGAQIAATTTTSVGAGRTLTARTTWFSFNGRTASVRRTEHRTLAAGGAAAGGLAAGDTICGAPVVASAPGS